MADLAYREVYTKNPIEARKLLIKIYQRAESIKKAARMLTPFLPWFSLFEVRSQPAGRLSRKHASPLPP